MTLKEKLVILAFVKEIDEGNLPEYVFHFEYDLYDSFESRMESTFECLFRQVFLPRDYKVFIARANEYRVPDFNALMTFSDNEIARVRDQILKLTKDDCDYLLDVAQDIRNNFTHGLHKKSEESTKQDLSEILFRALKNAYTYKTKKTLNLTFKEFFEAFKFSKKDELEAEKDELVAEKSELIDEIARLNKINEKYAIEITKKEIEKEERKSSKREKPTEVHAQEVAKEIKYVEVTKNPKYKIPNNLGKEIKSEHSPRIDIALDFVKKGWFEEARKEATEANNALTPYIFFLANNKLTSIDELINHENYKKLLEELLPLLKDLPVKDAREIFEEIVTAFCNIKEGRLNSKTEVFKVLINFNVESNKPYKENFIEYLLASKNKNDEKIKGFDLYFSSFADAEYGSEIIRIFEKLLSKHEFELIFSIKSNVIEGYDSPSLFKILLLAEARVDSMVKLESSIANITQPTYLEPLLNFDYYNNKKEFKALKELIVNEIEAQHKQLAQRNNISAINLLNCIRQYLTIEEVDKLIEDYAKAFENRTVWSKHQEEALDLLETAKGNKGLVGTLINSWLEESSTEAFSFYNKAIVKAKELDIQNNTILKNDILITLALTNNLKQYQEKPKIISEKQIEAYLRISNDTALVEKLIHLLPKLITKDNASIYAQAFETLLPYYKGTENDIFNEMDALAKELVKEGLFDKAEKLFRYMLSLKINSSECYWGLLFCVRKAKNIEELSKTKDLFEDDLFQAVLHTSKNENQEIYQQCIALYSSHKQNNEKVEKAHKEKISGALYAITLIVQSITIVGMGILHFMNISGVWWPYFIIGALIFASMFVHGAIRNKCKFKMQIITSVIFLTISSIPLTVIGSIHIHKAAHAEENYEVLQRQIQHFDSYGGIYSIKETINKIPSNYRDVKTIKEDAEDLERIFSKYQFGGRDRFGQVWNFDIKHSEWDCEDYYYNYGIHGLIYGANWKVEGSNKYFKYYYNNGERLGTDLPNNKDSSKEYYFYTEYGTYNNKRDYYVNQYALFGYENINDKNDKFLAFKIGNYQINNNGKRQLDAYCYADNVTYTLIYDSEA